MGKLIARTIAALIVAAAQPAAADPITVAQYGGPSGAAVTLVDTSHHNQIGINLAFTDTVDAYVAISGLRWRTTVLVNLWSTNATARPWTNVLFELLDPLGGGDDSADVPSYPRYVPAGWSTSNSSDGISFPHAEARRSTRFRSVVEDDQTDARDALTFRDGLVAPGQTVRFWFGIRESLKPTTSLLLRISPGPAATATPEPASLVLLASGTIGLFGARARRRRREA